MAGPNGPFIGQPIPGADDKANIAWCIQALKTVQNFLNVSSAHNSTYDNGNAPTLTSKNVNDAINTLDTNDVVNLAAITAALAGKQPLDATLTTLSGKDFVGLIAAFPKTAIPVGWLVIDGSNRSRTTYAALFAYLGTAFGVGDGSTTFGTPDARARAIFGYDAANATARLGGGFTGGLDASTIGNTGGERAHTPTLAELIAHNHTFGGQTQARTNQANTLSGGGALAGTLQTMDNTGSSAAHNTVPPGIVFQWCIFAGA